MRNPHEQPDPPRGPYEKPLCIEKGELTIDGTGIYDEDGILEAVRINGVEVPANFVSAALGLLKCNYPRWREPLDADDKMELSGACE
jgi:hypothetical protein